MSNTFDRLSNKKNRTHLTIRLTESAVMLALGTVLSLLPLAKMPFGGDITLFSMLPVAIIAYRHGTPWGLTTAFTYSLLQMLLGLDNLRFATSAAALVTIILMDYLVAFTVLGLAGLFRRKIQNQSAALVAGVLLLCVLRYVCHVIAGCTVWAGVSIPSSSGLVFSMGYNASYMIPETIITVAGAFFLGRILDFRRQTVTRPPTIEGTSRRQSALTAIGLLVAVIAVVFDAVYLISAMQSETAFDITLAANANWGLLAIVTLAGALVAAGFFLAARRYKATDK